MLIIPYLKSNSRLPIQYGTANFWGDRMAKGKWINAYNQSPSTLLDQNLRARCVIRRSEASLANTYHHETNGTAQGAKNKGNVALGSG